MYFLKDHAKNRYAVLACMDVFAFGKEPGEQEAKYDVWDTLPHFFKQVVDFYQGDPSIICYLKGGTCNSKSGSRDEE